MSQDIGFYPNRWYRADRQSRQADSARLRNRGIRPAKKQWMICVETTKLVIPAWALIRREKRLSVGRHQVWFKGRSNGRAQILARQDRQAGGDPIVTAVEWRPCGACGRILLNLEAEMRRRLDTSEPEGRKLACSAECGGVVA